MEEKVYTESYVKGMEEAHKRAKELRDEEAKRIEIGLFAGIVFAGMWIAALEWEGEFKLLEFLWRIVASSFAIALPVGLGMGSALANREAKSPWPSVLIALAINTALVFYVCYR